jgi:hypothetical protein
MERRMNDIYKRYKCDFCGSVEYKKYIGTEQFDGGYTTINKFDPSDYIRVNIGTKMSFLICPKCESKLQSFIDTYKLKKEEKNESV